MWHNGIELNTCALPSEGIRGAVGGINPENRRENIFHEALYSNLDAYFETTPGSEEAQKAIKQARRT